MMNKLSKNHIVLAIFLVIALISYFVAGSFAEGSSSTWYMRLAKPGYYPPEWVFFLVWTIIYILIGVGGYLLWSSSEGSIRCLALSVWFAQVAATILQTLFQFELQMLGWGLIWLIVLDGLVALMLLLSIKISNKAFFLFVPYGLWLIFATILNSHIYFMNT